MYMRMEKVKINKIIIENNENLSNRKILSLVLFLWDVELTNSFFFCWSCFSSYELLDVCLAWN